MGVALGVIIIAIAAAATVFFRRRQNRDDNPDGPDRDHDPDHQGTTGADTSKEAVVAPGPREHDNRPSAQDPLLFPDPQMQMPMQISPVAAEPVELDASGRPKSEYPPPRYI